MRRGPRRQFKVCLIGDGYVGKTSIRQEYLGKGFKASYIPTLGVDFAQKSLVYDDVETQLVIWDIAGQPLFQSLRKRYYQGCGGLILVYSVVDRTSFDNASKWLVEAYGFMGELPPLIVAGNKIDLRPNRPPEETVTPEEGQVFTEKFSAKLNTPAIFIETSALTGENIDDAFQELTGMMVERALERIRAKREGEIEKTPTAEPSTVEPTPASSPVRRATSSITNSASAEVSFDPVTSLGSDSPHLQEEQIGKHMSRLLDLRNELKEAEEELADITSQYETRLLELRNVVHVKKLMYEHLQTQIKETRQEWADAYEDYVETEERKKKEITRRGQQIEDIRKEIERVGKTIRSRVGDL
ncbi:GTP-binding protein, partial [Candidatus Thorarchaeota archaeon]